MLELPPPEAEPEPRDEAVVAGPKHRLALVFSTLTRSIPRWLALRPSAIGVLVGAGYELVDPEGIKMVRSGWSVADIDLGKIPVALNAMDADLVVFGTVDLSAQGKLRKSKFESVAATLSARVVEVDTASIIDAREVRSTGIEMTLELANRGAASKVSEKFSRALVGELQDIASGKGRLELVVRGLTSPRDAETVVRALDSLNAIAQTRLQFQSKKATKIRLTAPGLSGLTLAKIIEDASRIPLHVLQSSHRSIVAHYAPKDRRRTSLIIEKPEVSRSLRKHWMAKKLPHIVASALGGQKSSRGTKGMGVKFAPLLASDPAARNTRNALRLKSKLRAVSRGCRAGSVGTVARRISAVHLEQANRDEKCFL